MRKFWIEFDQTTDTLSGQVHAFVVQVMLQVDNFYITLWNDLTGFCSESCVDCLLLELISGIVACRGLLKFIRVSWSRVVSHRPASPIESRVRLEGAEWVRSLCSNLSNSRTLSAPKETFLNVWWSSGGIGVSDGVLHSSTSIARSVDNLFKVSNCRGCKRHCSNRI